MMRASALNTGLLARALMLACVVLAVVAGNAGIAEAVELPSMPALGFGESYCTGDRTFTHQGVDIQMEPETLVELLVGGRVRFAGSVPAAEGGTICAVTVEDHEGRLWSYLPLESLSVNEGQSVAEGDPVGHVASTGDPSLASTHLHVGLRIDGEYRDPALALGVAEVDSETAEEELLEAAPADVVLAVSKSADAPVVLQHVSGPVVSCEAAGASVTSAESGLSNSQAELSPVVEHLRERSVRDDIGQTALVSGQPVNDGCSRAPLDAIGPSVALAFVTLLGMTVGIVRTAQEYASRRVGADLGSTRLQPR